MRTHPLAALALAAVVACPTAQARPSSDGGGGVVVGPGRGARGAPGWGAGGGRWAGGPYRPWVGPRFGYGGWGWGYPGYGFGWGVGLGYGAGWALSAGWPWYWGGPGLYTVPAWGAFGYPTQVFPGFVVQEDLTFVQQAPTQSVEPAPAAPSARAPVSYWYYCTEPQGYYPYVQQCSRPWIAVNPASLPPPAEARPGAAPP